MRASELVRERDIRGRHQSEEDTSRRASDARVSEIQEGGWETTAKERDTSRRASNASE